MRGPTLKLYGHVNRLSPASLKLRVALAEVDAVYQYLPIDLAKGEQLTSEFLALNPHGKIPLLVEDDFVLAESDAILFYIAERYAEPRLLGSSPRERAQTLQWCDFASTALYTGYFEIYLHTQAAAPERRVPAIAESGQKRFDRALGVLDKVLAERNFLADEFSIADIACASVLRVARERVPYDADAHTATEAWYARVTSRPAWKTAIEEARAEARSAAGAVGAGQDR